MTINTNLPAVVATARPATVRLYTHLLNSLSAASDCSAGSTRLVMTAVLMLLLFSNSGRGWGLGTGSSMGIRDVGSHAHMLPTTDTELDVHITQPLSKHIHTTQPIVQTHSITHKTHCAKLPRPCESAVPSHLRLLCV